jgi:ribonuclease J
MKIMLKNEMSITFYGGVKEIGGNKILVRDRDTSVPRLRNVLRQEQTILFPAFPITEDEKNLQELGILPKFRGICRFHEDDPDIDAILILHGHLDHNSYLSFVE